MSLQRFVAFAGALLVAFCARAADISDSPVILVAKPEVGDFYRNTVLFARPLAGGRHVGFIVNRPTEATLAQDMFLVLDGATIDRVIEQNPSHARFYAGLVFWEPGELESELERGVWYVIDHDANLVFRGSTDGLWEELVRRSSG